MIVRLYRSMNNDRIDVISIPQRSHVTNYHVFALYQECGSLGSPGLANVLPPFASPVDTGRQNNFGSPVTFGGNTQQQFQPKPGVGSYGGQPLVDSTPFDSGNSKVVANMAKIVLLAMGINELLF